MPKPVKFGDRKQDDRIIGPGWIARCKHPDDPEEDILWKNFVLEPSHFPLGIPKTPKDFKRDKKYWITSNLWTEDKRWFHYQVYVGRWERKLGLVWLCCPLDLQFVSTNSLSMFVQHRKRN